MCGEFNKCINCKFLRIGMGERECDKTVGFAWCSLLPKPRAKGERIYSASNALDFRKSNGIILGKERVYEWLKEKKKAPYWCPYRKGEASQPQVYDDVEELVSGWVYKREYFENIYLITERKEKEN